MADEDEFLLVEGIAAEDSEFFIELRDEMSLEIDYDPHVEPEPEIWLSSDETERSLAVIQYHLRTAEPWGQSLRLHALGHVSAEDQIARGFAPAHSAMSLLMAAGHDRHAAIHVLASCVMNVLRKATRGKLVGTPDEMLTAEIRDALELRMKD